MQRQSGSRAARPRRVARSQLLPYLWHLDFHVCACIRIRVKARVAAKADLQPFPQLSFRGQCPLQWIDNGEFQCRSSFRRINSQRYRGVSSHRPHPNYTRRQVVFRERLVCLGATGAELSQVNCDIVQVKSCRPQPNTRDHLGWIRQITG